MANIAIWLLRKLFWISDDDYNQMSEEDRKAAFERGMKEFSDRNRAAGNGKPMSPEETRRWIERGGKSED